MKKIVIIPFLAILVLISVTCKKEDTLSDIRESISLDLIGAVNVDSLQSYVTWMQNMGTRFCLADNRREVASAIRDKFVSFGYTNARLDSFMLERSYRGIAYSLWQYNIIAELEGSMYPDSISILGGHYDSILSGTESDPFSEAPGAHDNASGVAAALEVARIMKARNFKPEGSIVFIAFAAEELGLHGSKNYSKKAFQESEMIKMMLNNDMIAYETSVDPSGWRVNIMDYPNSGKLLNLAESMAAIYTVLGTYNDNELNRYSDSYMFSEYGYPALFFFKDDYDPNYHSLDDIVDNCNFEYCREIVSICVAMLVHRNIYR